MGLFFAALFSCSKSSSTSNSTNIPPIVGKWALVGEYDTSNSKYVSQATATTWDTMVRFGSSVLNNGDWIYTTYDSGKIKTSTKKSGTNTWTFNNDGTLLSTLISPDSTGALTKFSTTTQMWFISSVISTNNVLNLFSFKGYGYSESSGTYYISSIDNSKMVLSQTGFDSTSPYNHDFYNSTLTFTKQ